MKRIYKILLLLLLLTYLFLQIGCGKDSQSQTKDDKKKDETVVPVEAAHVTRGDISAYFTGTATLEAEQETEVVAKVGGVVKKLYVEEGHFVKAGQILAKLDDEKLKVQLEQARANLMKLENDYRRSEEMMKKNLISTEEFQRTQFEYEHQKAAFELAQLDLDYTDIRAPIGGVIATRLIKVGNMVLVNQSTFKITSLNPLIAALHVPERQMDKLRPHLTAKLSVDAVNDAEFIGHIARISPVVDPTTGTVKVTIEVRDQSRQLKPGMFARINIIYDVHSNTVLVPKDAIMAEDKESSVFVVRDSVAYRQKIVTGYVNTTHVEVLDGILPGEIVVTTGKSSLKDSSKVELVSDESTKLSMNHENY